MLQEGTFHKIHTEYKLLRHTITPPLKPHQHHFPIFHNSNMLPDAEMQLIDSSDAAGDSSSLRLFIKNLRQEVKDVTKDLEELQVSFKNSRVYSKERSIRSERTSIVSFSTVQVREYNVTMGDYRSDLGQCPLTLGWEHGPSKTHDIDTFSKKKERQHGIPLERLTLHKRQDRLRAMGYYSKKQ
jgi:hypothetical protein